MPTLNIAGSTIEFEAWAGARSQSPKHPLVFLHEGLGCVALWRDFPRNIVQRSGRPAIAYSRRGYGHSSVIAPPWRTEYMHEEAEVVLPQLLTRLGIAIPVLIGHSDGASIALIHAAHCRAPIAGLVLLAPHVFVEDESIVGVEATRREYLETDLKQRLSKYHRDADATFWGWNDVWRSPSFRSWNIEQILPKIDCPVLVVQGLDDRYGTLAQADAIRRGVNGPVEQVLLADSGHAPHIDCPEPTTEAILGFLANLP